MIHNDKLVIGGHEFHSRFILGSGKYSMKLSVESKVVRSVPYLQDGKVSVDIYVPVGGGFTLELQSGYTRYYNSVSVPIAIRCENGKIYFGELTFSHWSGMMPFDPEEWDYKFGEWINLPENS